VSEEILLGDQGTLDGAAAEFVADFLETDEQPTVLAEWHWDLGPGGAGSPGNADSGFELLLRLDGAYYILQDADGFDIEPSQASSDEEAISKFAK